MLDPRTRFIAFTGSKEVGLHINELAAKTAAGAKLDQARHRGDGRKGPIVVAADADLEAAVEGVAVSAFGFGGQKCSACSRAIVEAPVYDEFVAKLRAQGRSDGRRRPGRPARLHGAGRQRRRVASRSSSYIETGKKEGRLVTGGRRIAGDGFFLEPTVIADVAPDAVIAQEEIFGPVLAVIKARDYDDALAIANNTDSA